MISVENVIKRFGETIAVDIENLKISRGEIFGLVGNNGAGKTTLLRLMLDLLKPGKGKIFSNGIPVYQSEHWKNYTGSYIDNNFLIEFLRPMEYFEFIGNLYNIKSEKLEKRLNLFTAFMNNEILDKKKYIRHLSSGNKHKVGIIGALISEPETLILDEPFNFLDPSSQINLKRIIKKLHDDKSSTIIISSHNLSHLSDLCTRIALMEHGKIINDFKNSIETMKKIEDYFNLQTAKTE